VKYISTKSQIKFPVLNFQLLFIYFLLNPYLLLSQEIKNDVFIKNFRMEQINISENNTIKILNFDNSIPNFERNNLPYYIEKHKIPSNISAINVKITNENFSVLNIENNDKIILEDIKDDVEINFGVANSRGEKSAVVEILPLKKKNGVLYVLNSFTIEIYYDYNYVNQKSIKSQTTNSVLSNGDIYKIAVLQDGIYKITYQDLKSYGIDPESLNPRNIKIFGNGGGMLPKLNSIARVDDLKEQRIFIEGESDGVFNEQDYILFYGMSPHVWDFNESTRNFERSTHLFSDTTYYFLKIDVNQGKRVLRTNNSSQSPTNVVTTFNDYRRFEQDNVNLIKSGNLWLGDRFDAVTNRQYTFSFPNLVINHPCHVRTSVVARSSQDSRFDLTVGNLVNEAITINWTSVNNYTSPYANIGNFSSLFNTNLSQFSVNLNYIKPNASSIGWLDFIEINARRNLVLSGKDIFFRDIESIGASNVSRFEISNVTLVVKLWEITDRWEIKDIEFSQDGNTLSFTTPTNVLKNFVAFDPNQSTSPFFAGKIQNQNLHGTNNVDYVIVTHPRFYNQAVELANYRQNEGLKVRLVTTNEVYNEFSSGMKDVSAIRDFMKMLYNRASNFNDMPRYLLLFGGGSYDNKENSPSNTNFILTYQSDESLSPTNTYVSDDYYGLLDDNEGTWSSSFELVDIGIGRLPVKTTDEARTIINKIKRYNSSESFGDWRNNLLFIGDDGDSNIHINQADLLATDVENDEKDLNISKIYVDAFPLISTPSGQRYPEVNEEINRRVSRGNLVVNYTGHGGELGWGYERFLTIADVQSWTNKDALSFFMTATCDFGPYDNPTRTSAGEWVLLNPEGGSIGILTTVRLVFATPNKMLNDNFYAHVFKNRDDKNYTIGDITRNTKTASGSSINNKNFVLLGDPAQKLLIPKYNVNTTLFNDNQANSSSDTINALSKVTISGNITDNNGQVMKNFNGVVYPTVYDKKSTVKTRGQKPDSNVRDFDVYNNILYKGKASVKNGEFTFSFIVPKDINYSFGKGRISYYADNGVVDASGYYNNFVIGGTNTNAPKDDEGPIIELYMNDKSFVFGGITDENPYLLAFVSDENGINTVGNGIGHDITAILDENTEKAMILNDYYEADMDSYKSGTIKYKVNDLEEGVHTLKLRVWDVYNNPSDANTEFIVAKSAQMALKHVLNYPNPFTTSTEFFFEHNQPNSTLDVQLQVFTISGKLVKTIHTFVRTEGFRSEGIPWNGLDDYGDKIARGVYVYRIKVRTQGGEPAEKIEKLVILN
jgi:hypothetical protein